MGNAVVIAAMGIVMCMPAAVLERRSTGWATRGQRIPRLLRQVLSYRKLHRRYAGE